MINLTTEELLYATDYCGVKSGRDIDKYKEMNLTPLPSEKISAPGIAESPVCIECKVTNELELGSHTMFVAEVVAITVDESYMEENGRFALNDSNPVAYSHGTYFSLGQELGTFGYSVKKAKIRKKKTARKD